MLDRQYRNERNILLNQIKGYVFKHVSRMYTKPTALALILFENIFEGSPELPPGQKVFKLFFLTVIIGLTPRQT